MKIYFATEPISQEADALSLSKGNSRLISYFYWSKGIDIFHYVKTGRIKK